MSSFIRDNEKNLNTVLKALSGKRREKFAASIAILDQSVIDGQWVKRGKVKAESGFYQGLFKPSNDYHDGSFRLYMTISYGQAHRGAFSHLIKNFELPKNITPEVVIAWVSLCNAKDSAIAELDDARPKPVLTKIGLSPKVTKTLQEMNLDIDLASIKYPEIAFRWVNKENVDGTPVRKNGKYVMEKEYYVKWPKDIVHGASRFGNTSLFCEACGKHIPSGLFAPVQALDRKSGKHVSFWLGLDCARNIFGVKDVGMRRPK